MRLTPDHLTAAGGWVVASEEIRVEFGSGGVTPMKRRPSQGIALWLCVVLVVGGLAPLAWARQAQVVTRDGQSFVGEVIAEDDAVVTLLISGIRVPIPRAKIRRIEYRMTVEEQYAQRRVQLADEDVDGRYLLAYWLFDNQAYALAKQELESLAEDFPDDSRVARLDSLVTARLVLGPKADEATPATQPASPEPVASDASPPGPAVREATGRISARQINLIKVFEIDLDAKPKVIVPREVMDRVFSDYAMDARVPQTAAQQNKLRRAPGYKQLELLFAVRARDLYDMVQVKEDPPTLRRFRTDIHQRYVLNYCGTVTCHGGAKAGDFLLHRLEPNLEPTVYTNFLKLQSTTVGQLEMINRQRPLASLLLQFGLARDRADSPHPDVARWQPKFQDRQDALFQSIESWIDSLWKPTPNYGIEAGPPAQEDHPIPPGATP